MPRPTSRVPILTAMLMGMFVVGPMTQGQDQRPAPPERQRGEGDPGRLMGLLERRAEQLERQQTRLREIRQRLEQGESPAATLVQQCHLAALAQFGQDGRGGEREEQRGPREGDAQGPRGPEDMSPEDYTLWRNRAMAFFERHAPEMATRLSAQADSDDARRAIFRLRREVDRLIELRDNQSEEFQPALERLRNGMRISAVLGRVRDAANAGTLTADLLATLREELSAVVAGQYDAQLESREIWLDRMGQRLRGAREKLERERAERSERIEAEVQAMLDRATTPRDEQGPSGGPPRRPR